MKEALINSYDNEILFLKRELHRRINFYKKINKYNKKTIKNFFNEQNNSKTVNFLKNLYK